MIILGNQTRERAIFRILTMPEGLWAGAGGENSQVWTQLPIPAIFRRDTGDRFSDTVAQGGYHISSITRWCLPDEDRAEFYIDTGTINGVVVAAQDLSNKAVRIQVWDSESAPGTAASLSSATWKTVWAGTVIYQKTTAEPGSTLHSRVVYYCAGVLWRTRNWPLDRHNTQFATHAKGNPGYNVPLHGFFRRVLGNKSVADISGQDPYGDMAGTPSLQSYYLAHELPLSSTTSTSEPWTDAQVIKHALASSRAFGEPLITVNLGTSLFDSPFSWSVNPGDSCWDLLRKICNRQRGRGSVYLDYSDQGNPIGPLRLILTSTPSFAGDLTYFSKKNDQDMDLQTKTTISGANQGTDAIDVDINGDHRVVDGSFNYDNRLTSVYDYIDIQGEPIQVLVNLNFYGSSLGKRWSAADESSFGGLSQLYQRLTARWRHVWRRFGIPTGAWDYKVTGEPGGTASSVDYYLDDAGKINVAPSHGPFTIDNNSQMMVKILPDLPIYEGWDYRPNTAVRWDGSVDAFPPPRMPPLIMVKGTATASDGSTTWANLQLAGSWTMQVDDYGLLIVYGPEEPLGKRVLSTPALAQYAYAAANLPGVDLTNGFVLNTLNCAVGLELGSHVRISYNTADYQHAGRRLLMTINGLSLWLGAPGCIWELDYLRATQSNYPPGLKFAGASPTILRDDRNALALIAALSWQYYGKVHNPAVWSLNDCGFLTSFSTVDKTVAYPTIGKLVGKITYAGDASTGAEVSATLNTSITCIHYDHDALQTTWHTDYVSYDGNLQ
jgi:hypothetical protein